MKRLSTLLSLFLLLTFSCRDDDQITLTTCKDGDTFALDFRPLSFDRLHLWLTEADGDLAFDEELTFSTGGLDFLNFPKACEEEYTISNGSFRTVYEWEPEAFVQMLSVMEVAKVRNGSVLDLQGGSLDLGRYVNSLPEGTIVVHHCPPIDSVRFWVNRNEYSVIDSQPPYTSEYHPGDSVLVLYTLLTQRQATDALLAIRSSQDGSWKGQQYGAIFEAAVDYSYDDLEPLTKESLAINWPADAENVELEIRWINSVTAQGSMILAFEERTADIEVPMPADAHNGPFVIRAKWKDTETYETQYVYDSWPGEITIGSGVDGEIVSFDYPSLRYEASGADIVMMEGIFEDAETYDVGERVYAGPAETGSAEIRFAPLSPKIGAGSSRVGRLYERSFDGSVAFNLYYFPAMDGSYPWYLRNILSDLATGEEWLRSLEYERLILPL